jgi:RNA polymerase sigma-70 factor, ECF subfamily
VSPVTWEAALEASQTREARFNKLYDANLDRLRAYAWRRDPSHAEEIVAETFLIAWRRLERVPEDSLPWLIGVARNVRLNLRRRERRRDALEQRVAADKGVVEPDFIAGVVEHATLTQALQHLGELDREILLLAAWEDLDSASIAAALGCSRANVAMRLFRARRRLAAALEKSDTQQVVVTEPTTSGGISDGC